MRDGLLTFVRNEVVVVVLGVVIFIVLIVFAPAVAASVSAIIGAGVAIDIIIRSLGGIAGALLHFFDLVLSVILPHDVLVLCLFCSVDKLPLPFLTVLDGPTLPFFLDGVILFTCIYLDCSLQAVPKMVYLILVNCFDAKSFS